MYVYRRMVFYSCTELFFFSFYAVKLKRQISQPISFWNGCCPVWTGQWSKPYWNSPPPLLILPFAVPPWPLHSRGCHGQWQHSVRFKSTFPFPPLWLWEQPLSALHHASLGADLASLEYLKDEDSGVVILLNISSVIPALSWGKFSHAIQVRIRGLSFAGGTC